MTLSDLESSRTILAVSGLTKTFGALKAVDDISFDVAPGEILGIAGPNGSGKSTLFNAITRIPFSATAGVVLFEGQEVHHLLPHDIATAGIARTFQRESVFPSLSAIDNVLTAIEQTRRGGSFQRNVVLAEQALDVVGFPATLHNWRAAELPIFLRKLVMIGSAMALDPKILLLDEPASSLTPEEIERMRALIANLKAMNVTILLIEHVLPLLTSVSDRLMVMDQGRIIAMGAPDAVIRDPNVVEAYLGVAI
ncbi:ABC transporter ATP-binding protein [Pelagibius sp. Alg239-R121]|uniref:ABC transporter ATP-binding protein n=1 Tax=Pelagibius sp. Alg239-R121 TaxID=2993448 RepID=UPI0024A671E5|nr:ABC transporter ATP-binding protein [Pelagibius sp. Alg239-R121]